jgi:hypothetical protein
MEEGVAAPLRQSMLEVRLLLRGHVLQDRPPTRLEILLALFHRCGAHHHRSGPLAEHRGVGNGSRSCQAQAIRRTSCWAHMYPGVPAIEPQGYAPAPQ